MSSLLSHISTEQRLRDGRVTVSWIVSFITATGLLAISTGHRPVAAQEATPSGGGTSKASGSAIEAFEAGSFDQAAEGFARRAQRKPRDAGAQLNLGSALHQLEDYDGARSAFERALSSDDRRLKAKE